MVGLQSFIIKTSNEFNETFVSGGHTWYGDKRFHQDRLIKHEVKVLETPSINYSGPIKKGSKVFLDLSVFLRYISHEGEYENNYTISKKEGLYKIPESLIYMYKNDNGQWIGNSSNLLVKVKKDKPIEHIKKGVIIPMTLKTKPKYIIAFSNEELMKNNLNVGDEVIVDESQLLPIYHEGEIYYHLITDNVYGKCITQ